MYHSKSYLIHCQTNLHAGSGDTNYGIIDKMVQRDPVTELPSIYPSSLKGAFREYFEEGPDKDTFPSKLIEGIFGNKVMKQEKEETDNSKGNTIFHEAQIIGLPLRSNKQPFFIATNKLVLQNWLKKAALLGLNYPVLKAEIDALGEITAGEPKILGNSINALMIEDFENVGNINATCTELKKYLGNNIVLMHYDDFSEVCSDYNLPVIARNNLENGESRNLWYEQIVPHQSRFVFFTVSIDEDRFSSLIHEKTIQIGANSSLGYGYCKITKI